ncbi:hypothetical protein V8C86DRAFT_2929613 [Haematococcus lacustris]
MSDPPQRAASLSEVLKQPLVQGTVTAWTVVYQSIKAILVPEKREITEDALTALKDRIKASDVVTALVGVTVVLALSYNAGSRVRAQLATLDWAKLVDKTLGKPVGTALIQALLNWAFLYGAEPLGIQAHKILSSAAVRKAMANMAVSQCAVDMKEEQALGLPFVGPYYSLDLVALYYEGNRSLACLHPPGPGPSRSLTPLGPGTPATSSASSRSLPPPATSSLHSLARFSNTSNSSDGASTAAGGSYWAATRSHSGSSAGAASTSVFAAGSAAAAVGGGGPGGPLAGSGVLPGPLPPSLHPHQLPDLLLGVSLSHVTPDMVPHLVARMQADAQHLNACSLKAQQEAAELQQHPPPRRLASVDDGYQAAERCSDWRPRVSALAQLMHDPGCVTQLLEVLEAINAALSAWQQFASAGPLFQALGLSQRAAWEWCVQRGLEADKAQASHSQRFVSLNHQQLEAGSQGARGGPARGQGPGSGSSVVGTLVSLDTPPRSLSGLLPEGVRGGGQQAPLPAQRSILDEPVYVPPMCSPHGMRMWGGESGSLSAGSRPRSSQPGLGWAAPQPGPHQQQHQHQASSPLSTCPQGVGQAHQAQQVQPFSDSRLPMLGQTRAADLAFRRPGSTSGQPLSCIPSYDVTTADEQTSAANGSSSGAAVLRTSNLRGDGGTGSRRSFGEAVGSQLGSESLSGTAISCVGPISATTSMAKQEGVSAAAAEGSAETGPAVAAGSSDWAMEFHTCMTSLREESPDTGPSGSGHSASGILSCDAEQKVWKLFKRMQGHYEAQLAYNKTRAVQVLKDMQQQIVGLQQQLAHQQQLCASLQYAHHAQAVRQLHIQMPASSAGQPVMGTPHQGYAAQPHGAHLRGQPNAQWQLL